MVELHGLAQNDGLLICTQIRMGLEFGLESTPFPLSSATGKVTIPAQKTTDMTRISTRIHSAVDCPVSRSSKTFPGL